MDDEQQWATKNRGEWSELYVLFKALGDGRIYGANGDLQVNKKIYLDVNRVVRTEDSTKINFIRNAESETVLIYINDNFFQELSTDIFKEEYRKLYTRIIEGKGRSFAIPETELFLRSLGCHNITASSSDKTDITIEVHEPKTGMDLVQGYSIKSRLGGKSTLINSSQSTNFEFSLDGNVSKEITEEANKVLHGDSKSKIKDGISYLTSKDVTLRFRNTYKDTIRNNLVLLDSNLPRIVSEMLKLYYENNISLISKQIEILQKNNPLEFPHPERFPYYEYKIKKLLMAYALGMQSDTPWNGYEEANGGYIVVKEDGDVVCFHIFDRNNFGDYLVKNTFLDTPSPDKHHFGVIVDVKKDKEYRICLNLQVRFIEDPKQSSSSEAGHTVDETRRKTIRQQCFEESNNTIIVVYK